MAALKQQLEKVECLGIPVDKAECVPPPLDEKEYNREKIRLLKEYNIGITFMDIGCLIGVGCRNIAFSSVKEGMEALNAYVQDPVNEKMKWFRKFDEII